jgi:hypothetical protein
VNRAPPAARALPGPRVTMIARIVADGAGLQRRRRRCTIVG